jgi:hypothetical protein
MPGDGGRPASPRGRRGLGTNRSRAFRWVAPLLGLAGCASDDVSGLTADKRSLLPGSTIGTPSLPAGTSEWTVYDSGLVAVSDAAAAAAMPVTPKP